MFAFCEQSVRPAWVGLALAISLPGCAGTDADGTAPPAARQDVPCSHEPADLPFDPGPCYAWEDPDGVAVVTEGLEPVHSARGAVGPPNGSAELLVRLAYGSFPSYNVDQGKVLDGERGTIWLERCDGWSRAGTFVTDELGFAEVTVPTAGLDPGLYEGWILADGDHAGSRFRLLVVDPAAGVDAVVTDIDATLTTDNLQQLEPDPAMIPSADDTFRALANDKGYAVFYMTARGIVAQRDSINWLIDKGFPPGVLQTAVPPNAGGEAAEYKQGSIEGWQALGVDIRYAFGNADTDLEGYFGAGLPTSSIFSINESAGDEGTIPVTTATTVEDGLSYASFNESTLPDLPAAAAPLPQSCP